jgi:hypothetical protein
MVVDRKRKRKLNHREHRATQRAEKAVIADSDKVALV